MQCQIRKTECMKKHFCFAEEAKLRGNTHPAVLTNVPPIKNGGVFVTHNRYEDFAGVQIRLILLKYQHLVDNLLIIT